ncbi:MAG TPA: beta-ketoacyl-ACP synthase III [Acidimicrobiia bacterium]|nr:beta-ketoacyl-ACP synthase III [Acidimicrobiia bacterium]
MNAAITGWGTAVPEGRLTNADLERRVETSDAWIIERTGIRERRIAGPGETTASLAVAAGAEAIKHAALTPDEIDLLIVATMTPEQPLPHTGAFVGDGLGLTCGSFDLGAGCAGFVYALVTASSLLTTSSFDHALVIGAETLSRVIDPTDRSTSVLFGDAAAAVVLGPNDGESFGLQAFDLGCDGSATGILGIPGGGSRLPTSPQTVAEGAHFVTMDGRQVFRRAVRAVVDSATITLERAGASPSDVDWFVPHQANARIIDAAAQRIGIPPERTVVNVDRYGNTSAASIPLALAEAADAGRIRTGDRLLLSGFGAGLTWASAFVTWGRP